MPRPNQSPQQLRLSAPPGPIAAKYNAFRMMGEPGFPGYRRYREMWSIGDVSTAKCVAYGTLVRSGDALIPIEKFAPTTDMVSGGFYPLQAEVLSRSGPQQTSHFYYGGEVDTRTIALANGQTLTGTDIHPVLAYSPTGPQWKRLGDLGIGDRIAVRVEAPRLVESDDEGYLLGLIIGDGHLAKNYHQVSIWNMDPEVAQFILGQKWFTVKKYEYANNRAARYALGSLTPSVKGSGCARQLEAKYGLKQAGANHKTVPLWVLEGSLSVKRGFLQGLFDTDGTAEKRGGAVSLSSNSRELVSQVQQMLLMFGVLSRINQQKASYKLECYGAYAKAFYEFVGFRIQRKQERGTALRLGRVYEPLPGIGSLLKKHIKEVAGKTKHVWPQYNSYFSGYVNPSAAMVRRILEEFPQESSVSKVLEELSSPLFAWIPVEDIAHGRGVVADLTVPAGHEYTAAGMVVHNTSAMCDAIIISAQNYPGARLLVLRKTKEDARLSVWQTLLDRARFLLKTGEWEYIRDLDLIRCSNGSTIHMYGLDTADDKLWGQEWFRAFVDQGEQLREPQIALLLTRVRQQVKDIEGRAGQTYIKLTANWNKGKNWVYKRIVKSGQMVVDAEGKAVPDFHEQEYSREIMFKGKLTKFVARVCVIISRTEENESNTSEYMENLVLAGAVGQQAMAGDWVENKGLMFLDTRDDFVINPKEPNRFNVDYDSIGDWHGKICVMGLDWGVQHPYYIPISQVNRRGQFVQMAELFGNGRTETEVGRLLAINLMAYRQAGCKDFFIFYDVSMHEADGDRIRSIDKFMAPILQLPFAVSYEPAVKNRYGSIEIGVTDIKTAIERSEYAIVESNCPQGVAMFRDIVWEDLAEYRVQFGMSKNDTWGIVDVFDGIRYKLMNRRRFVPIGYEDAQGVIHDPLAPVPNHPGTADEEDRDITARPKLKGWGWNRRMVN